MIDPDSARIEWPFNFVGGTLKPRIGRHQAGYYTCGFVNARNRMGGYTGKTWFLIMEHDGAVTSLEIGDPSGISVADATCPGMAKKGFFPAAPAIAPASTATPMAQIYAQADDGAAAAAARGGVGISFLPTPFGMLLMAVAPNSPAARAGLKQGETVEAVNGISMKGMSQAAVLEILSRLEPQSTFTVVGAGDVKVTKP
jgi:membrane-associated protease RseP (regulator of RpoE activity)